MNLTVNDSLKNKKVKVTYQINTGKPYVIDSIFRNIDSPIVDSLYQNISGNSLIKTGETYTAENISNEKKRIATEFRNRGLYHFQENRDSKGVPSFNYDVKQTLESMEKFEAFAKEKNANVFIQHSPADLERIKKLVNQK